jgi:hypothetical protein
MTAQIPDILMLNGQKHSLFSLPLEVFFEKRSGRPKFRVPHTGCWRGYVASWEVRDNRLFLLSVRGQLSDGAKFDAAWLFPNETLPVFAEWFTGTLKLPLGNVVEYVHMGFASFYEDELQLTVERGMVIKKSRRNANPLRWPRFRTELWMRRLLRDF